MPSKKVPSKMISFFKFLAETFDDWFNEPDFSSYEEFLEIYHESFGDYTDSPTKISEMLKMKGILIEHVSEMYHKLVKKSQDVKSVYRKYMDVEDHPEEEGRMAYWDFIEEKGYEIYHKGTEIILEEVKFGKKGLNILDQLKSLETGTEIWYHTDNDYAIKASKYPKKVEAKQLIPLSRKALVTTHRLLGRLKEEDLDKIYTMMQAEIWAVDVEAVNSFLERERKEIDHSSMTIGDIIIKGERGYVAVKRPLRWLEFTFKGGQDAQKQFNQFLKKVSITIADLDESQQLRKDLASLKNDLPGKGILFDNSLISEEFLYLVVAFSETAEDKFSDFWNKHSPEDQIIYYDFEQDKFFEIKFVGKAPRKIKRKAIMYKEDSSQIQKSSKGLKQVEFDDLVYETYLRLRERPNQHVKLAQIWEEMNVKGLSWNDFSSYMLNSLDPRFHLTEGKASKYVKNEFTNRNYSGLVGNEPESVEKDIDSKNVTKKPKVKKLLLSEVSRLILGKEENLQEIADLQSKYVKQGLSSSGKGLIEALKEFGENRKIDLSDLDLEKLADLIYPHLFEDDVLEELLNYKEKLSNLYFDNYVKSKSVSLQRANSGNAIVQSIKTLSKIYKISWDERDSGDQNSIIAFLLDDLFNNAHIKIKKLVLFLYNVKERKFRGLYQEYNNPFSTWEDFVNMYRTYFGEDFAIHHLETAQGIIVDLEHDDYRSKLVLKDQQTEEVYYFYEDVDEWTEILEKGKADQVGMRGHPVEMLYWDFRDNDSDYAKDRPRKIYFDDESASVRLAEWQLEAKKEFSELYQEIKKDIIKASSSNEVTQIRRKIGRLPYHKLSEDEKIELDKIAIDREYELIEFKAKIKPKKSKKKKKVEPKRGGKTAKPEKQLDPDEVTYGVIDLAALKVYNKRHNLSYGGNKKALIETIKKTKTTAEEVLDWLADNEKVVNQVKSRKKFDYNNNEKSKKFTDYLEQTLDKEQLKEFNLKFRLNTSGATRELIKQMWDASYTLDEIDTWKAHSDLEKLEHSLRGGKKKKIRDNYNQVLKKYKHYKANLNEITSDDFTDLLSEIEPIIKQLQEIPEWKKYYEQSLLVKERIKKSITAIYQIHQNLLKLKAALEFFYGDEIKDKQLEGIFEETFGKETDYPYSIHEVLASKFILREQTEHFATFLFNDYQATLDKYRDFFDLDMPRYIDDEFEMEIWDMERGKGYYITYKDEKIVIKNTVGKTVDLSKREKENQQRKVPNRTEQREIEISLQLKALGYSITNIAQNLEVNESTVQEYFKNLGHYDLSYLKILKLVLEIKGITPDTILNDFLFFPLRLNIDELKKSLSKSEYQDIEKIINDNKWIKVVVGQNLGSKDLSVLFPK